MFETVLPETVFGPFPMLFPLLQTTFIQDNVARQRQEKLKKCRTPQLVGNFEALRFIEAEAKKRKNKAEKAKEEKNQKGEKQIYSHLSVAVSCGHFLL